MYTCAWIVFDDFLVGSIHKRPRDGSRLKIRPVYLKIALQTRSETTTTTTKNQKRKQTNKQGDKLF